MPSLLAAARVRPSGLNATELTPSVPPASGWPSRAGRAGSVTFHSQTMPSVPPAARVRPSGLNATEEITFLGPVDSVLSRAG